MAAAGLAGADVADETVDGSINANIIVGLGNSYRMVGRQTEDCAGYSVASAGDVDVDGRDYLIIGADYLMSASSLVEADGADGSVHGKIDLSLVRTNVIRGSGDVIGTSGSELLYGGTAADALFGNGGNTFFSAGPEADLSLGGLGNDHYPFRLGLFN